MTKLIMMSLTMLYLSAMMMIGCKSSSQKVDDAQEDAVEAEKALDDANLEYKKDMELYRTEMSEKIAANEKIVADFTTRIESEKKSVREDYLMKIKELNQKNSDLKMKMDEYNLDGKDKWDSFKAEFSRDMDELGNALRDLTVKNNK